MDNLRVATLNRGQKVTISVNGRICEACEGESLHGVLFAEGYTTLRKTMKTGLPRGIFCGMGVCYECLVTINGIPNQRACMTRVEEGMEIFVGE